MRELAARLARGEEAAFAELYDACVDRLHRYLTARLRSFDQASDVLQTTFLRAVSSRKRFARVENPIAYLFQIARNEAIRAGSRWQRAEKLPPDLAAASQNPSRDDAEVVAFALQRLRDEDREIVELKIFAELTFREISNVTGLPQGTVATQYRRALESVRPWLSKQFQ